MLSIALSTALALGAMPARSNLIVSPCEFGEAYQYESVSCEIPLRNVGERPIRISGIRAIRSEDTISAESRIVPPNGTIYLKTEIALLNSSGRTRRYFQFKTDEQGGMQRNAEAVGYVASILDDAKPGLDFGVLRAAELPRSLALQLESREVEDLRITKILSKPEYIDATILNDGRSIEATVRRDAPWGLYHRDYIKVALDSARQSQAWIAIKLDVHGEVVPDSNPFALGLMRQGAKNDFILQLRNLQDKEFRIGGIRVDRIDAKVEPADCVPQSDACKALHISVNGTQPTGEVGGVVMVELPDFGKTLPVYVWGMMVGPKTEVRNLDEEIRKSEDAGARASQTSAAASIPRIDISKALSESADAPAPPPPGNGPLLKWTVAHDSPVYGYAIYRSEAEAGPYLRVSARTIVVADDGDKSSTVSYQWRDTTAVSGKVYWYYIGTLLIDGTKEKLTSPQKVLAK